jgi:hypothetical protein
MNDKEFVNGLIAKAPHEKAPDFVKVDISIKREELIKWLSGKQEDWININVKESKGGKWYAEVNDWKPEAKQEGGAYDENGDVPY